MTEKVSFEDLFMLMLGELKRGVASRLLRGESLLSNPPFRKEMMMRPVRNILKNSKNSNLPLPIFYYRNSFHLLFQIFVQQFVL